VKPRENSYFVIYVTRDFFSPEPKAREKMISRVTYNGFCHEVFRVGPIIVPRRNVFFGVAISAYRPFRPFSKSRRNDDKT
jgi:hypothetical protein